MRSNILSFVISLSLTFPANAGISSKIASKGLNRRTFINCGAALSTYMTLGYMGQLYIEHEKFTHWNEKTQKLELNPDYKSRLSEGTGSALSTFSGMGTNLAIGKILDAMNAFTKKVNEADEKSPSYFDTMMQANMVLIGELIVTALLPFKNGNAGMEGVDPESLLASPAKLMFESVVLAPVIEELIFRFLPGAVISKGWALGLLSSGVFAAAHNMGDLNFKTIPVPQFIFGLFAWYLMREKGIDHSILAHMANNNSVAMAIYFSNVFR